MEATAAPAILGCITETIGGGVGLPHDELSRKLSTHAIEKLQEEFPGTTHKFVVQTTVVPQSSSSGFIGISMSSAAIWDTARDCTFNVKWENKEVHVVVTVVAIAL
mmetsp:Transcript_5324/g.11200  ORF Transcript_5324/g.11200 Transcript_5324/m.11200 type:complete len:106 (+) Transcript_5324:52-369(+)